MALKKRKKLIEPPVIGKKGGANSRKYMTPEEASELGRRAVRVRWDKAKGIKRGKPGKGPA